TVTSTLPASKHSLLTELASGLDENALHWISGYFAGLAEARPAGATPAAGLQAVSSVAAAAPHRRATILFGSQTGNAKRTAEALFERLQAEGLPARLIRADRY